MVDGDIHSPTPPLSLFLIVAHPLIQISFSPQPFAVIEIKDNCTILFYQPLFLG